MEWKVCAEATGFLTLKTSESSIKLDNIEICLKDPTAASDEPYQVVQSWAGCEPPDESIRTKPIPLLVTTTIEADSPEEARIQGYYRIETTLGMVFLASSAPITPANVITVSKEIRDQEKTTIDFSHKIEAFTNNVVVWKDDFKKSISALAKAILRIPEMDRTYLYTALHWWRKAGTQQEPEIQFLFLWFAIEALSYMSFVNIKAEELKCNRCNRPLRCSCGAEQSRIPDVRYKYLLNLTGVMAKKECNKYYRLRSKVVHGVIGILPDEEKQIKECIPKLNESLRLIIEGILNNKWSI